MADPPRSIQGQFLRESPVWAGYNTVPCNSANLNTLVCQTTIFRDQMPQSNTVLSLGTESSMHVVIVVCRLSPDNLHDTGDVMACFNQSEAWIQALWKEEWYNSLEIL